MTNFGIDLEIFLIAYIESAGKLAEDFNTL